ncbi:hypothetical protein HHK36_000490 [Tetracentron sinense]|uniref:Uncharacterized protein n=1 Tax=Tetracentron sinense TaxID=13715 RepID=A0A835A1R2_TETSI|nr:hypothetical protein HHK36_000490 [Tetracentron sinense]
MLRAKIPISVFGLPFISGITAGDPTELSFNLRTNSQTGPSLKFSYNPNPNSTNTNPFSISLKSGVGIFGSPNNSPLIMTAHFNLFGNRNPSFSLQIKPQFGDFSLKKTAVSASLPNPNPNPNPVLPKENGGVHLNGFLPERPLVWRDLTSEFHGPGDGFFSGVAVTAKTVLPVTKRAVVKFRWGVNFPTDFGGNGKLPFLTVDKIGIERVEEEIEVKPKSSESSVGDPEVLKGMCLWMRREVEVLQRENRAMKESLEEVRLGVPLRNHSGETDNFGKKSLPSVEKSTEFERWRSKKNGGEDNGRRETKKSESPASDVEEELKRAIKAASS